MDELKSRVEPTWQHMLATEKKADYFQAILQSLEVRRASGECIYPPANMVFQALKATEYANVKVVILGQDPYHGPGQAHGLCFSVQPPVPAPPSLQNIFKALQHDLGCHIPSHGCLNAWANQGVLLLNTVLTVARGQPQSHAKLGWQRFTDCVIEKLNQHSGTIVFMLWGSHAQKKAGLIDSSRHLILKSVHPSPLSAHRGFLTCQHFSKANSWLIEHGREAIDWSLPNTL